MYGCARVPGVIITLISSTGTVYLLAAQWTLPDDQALEGNHNALEVIGAGLVVIGSIVPAIVQARNSKTPKPQEQQ